MSVGSQTQEIPCVIRNWYPYTDDKEMLKKETDHSGLVGTGLLIYETCPGWPQADYISTAYLPTRILTVYIQAFTGFSHIYHPDGLHNALLSQVWVLENGSDSGNSGQNILYIFQGPGKGMRSLWLPGFSSQFNDQLHPLSDLLQQCLTFPQVCLISSWIHVVTHVYSPASKFWPPFSAWKVMIYSPT